MKVFIFLFFIFLISFSSSLELKASPSQLNFEGLENENICKTLTIFTDSKSIILGEDRWAEKGIMDRTFLNHKLESSDLDLKIDYPKNKEIFGSEKIKICISGEKDGNYHGILLYKTKKNPAGVGIWLNIKIIQGEGKFAKITGSAINDGSHTFGLTIVFVLLFIIAFILSRDFKNNAARTTSKSTEGKS
ncbi:hypothetical protein HOD88_01695 [archaeon]|jgi:hypothetical protein|nr:hypothetical protein [archaeon]